MWRSKWPSLQFDAEAALRNSGDPQRPGGEVPTSTIDGCGCGWNVLQDFPARPPKFKFESKWRRAQLVQEAVDAFRVSFDSCS